MPYPERSFVSDRHQTAAGISSLAAHLSHHSRRGDRQVSNGRCGGIEVRGAATGGRTPDQSHREPQAPEPRSLGSILPKTALFLPQYRQGPLSEESVSTEEPDSHREQNGTGQPHHQQRWFERPRQVEDVA